MWLDLFLLAVGGVMLYYGAEWLVQGAAGMAVRLGVRPLLIGLTIVSYATSAPELAVSISAALRHDGPLVLGNVFGSNIANIALILGLTVLIAPPKSDGSMRGRELWFLLAATVAAPAFLLNDQLERWEAVLLLLGSVAFTWMTIRWSKTHPPDLDEVPTDEGRTKGVLVAIGTVGLVVLIGGGDLFVRGAVGLAEALGVDERVIGLTVVAFGTSVPELAASVTMPRGHMASCGAGRSVLGIEADGAIKGCPSLPTEAWTGGNVRDDSLKDIWERSKPLRYTRDRSVEDLWGYCRECYYADVCRAGCTWTSFVFFGKAGNNPYCHHRALERQRAGQRERVVRVEQAPGAPFDFGRFEIVLEELES
jgi:cation:H+ antiporter